MPSSFSVGRLGMSGERLSVAMARNLSCPASALPFCVRFDSATSMWLPRSAFMRGAVPSYETYLNLSPAAFSTSAGKKWLVEPRVAPTLICPGRALASASSSCHDDHFVLGLAVTTEGVFETEQTGSKSV